MLERAYIRYKPFVDIPDNPNAYAAADGFAQMGIPIVPFRDVDIAEGHVKAGPDSIVCGYISDVWKSLKQCDLPVPNFSDYPEHLKWALGREIEKRTIAWVREQPEDGDQFFVKPVKLKQFTGFVWTPGDPRSILNIATIPPDAECWVSKRFSIWSEWRAFIKHNRIIGVKHYKGEWDHVPSRAQKFLCECIDKGRNIMPCAYALDVGCVPCDLAANGMKMILVEANDGYALGAYGLSSIVYARFLEARWAEMFGVSSNA